MRVWRGTSEVSAAGTVGLLVRFGKPVAVSVTEGEAVGVDVKVGEAVGTGELVIVGVRVTEGV